MPINGLLDAFSDRVANEAARDSLVQHWFAEQVRRAYASENGTLAELLYACAIPAAFDIQAIGILREEPNDAAFNGWLFEAITSLSIVHRVRGGRYTYLPAVRERILADFNRPTRVNAFRHYARLMLDYYLGETQRLYRRGQLEVAYMLTDQALALPYTDDPANRDAFEYLDAQNAYALVYLWRGRIMDALRQTPDAIREYDQAIRQSPGFGDPYFHRGMDYEALGDHTMALEDLSQSIRLQPDDGYNYWGRGYIYYQSAQYEPALQDFDSAVRYQPGLARNYHWRACTYRALRDFHAALADHHRAVELEPQNATLINHRGITYDTLGDHESAVNDYSQAIQLEPRDPAFFFNRGNARAALGEYLAAIADYDEAIRRDPRNAAMYLQRGLIHDQLGRYAEALADYSRTIELQPQNAAAHTFRAMSRFPVAPNAALLDAGRAVALESRGTLQLYWYALIALSCGYADKAADAIHFALRQHPQDAMAHYWRGLIALTQRDHFGAYSALDWSLSLRNDLDNRVYGLLWRWLIAALNQPTLGERSDPAAQMLYNRLQAALTEVENPIQQRKLAVLIALGQGRIDDAQAAFAAEPPLSLGNTALLVAYIDVIVQCWSSNHPALTAMRGWITEYLRARYGEQAQELDLFDRSEDTP